SHTLMCSRRGGRYWARLASTKSRVWRAWFSAYSARTDGRTPASKSRKARVGFSRVIGRLAYPRPTAGRGVRLTVASRGWPPPPRLTRRSTPLCDEPRRDGRQEAASGGRFPEDPGERRTLPRRTPIQELRRRLPR